MKKGISRLIAVLIVLIAAGVYYYFTLPVINIHSQGFWTFLLFMVVLVTIIIAVRKSGKEIKHAGFGLELLASFKKQKLTFAGVVLFLALLVIFAVGNLLSSPIVNAAKYEKLLKVTTSDFTKDVKEVDYNSIPLLDKNSAQLLGNRKMGSMVDMVSQFEVEDDYTQIDFNNKPVRISPLRYASGIKWLTNHKNGIPAYMMIDMAKQDVQVVKLKEGIHFSKSEYFNNNIYRHLRFAYPTYIFSDQISFEIDDSGTPYWIAPVKKFNIGLFGGETIGRVVMCNAITGELKDYAVKDVPKWVDKVYSAELLTQLFDYYGIYKHGYFNSVLAQKDCLQTTNGYNYIAKDDDIWVYTGVTSMSKDQSMVGFILMNQRTMETRYYEVEGAIEESAMASAEGQVQNLKYHATFPLLLNISDEPTYFIALKDDAGLVKKYAMVNVQKYQWVAIGDTVKECEKNYSELLATNGIKKSEQAEMGETIQGTITAIAPVVIEGNTHYYISLAQSQKIFDVNLTDTSLIQIVRYVVGDSITFTYTEGASDLCTVSKLN